MKRQEQQFSSPLWTAMPHLPRTSIEPTMLGESSDSEPAKLSCTVKQPSTLPLDVSLKWEFGKMVSAQIFGCCTHFGVSCVTLLVVQCGVSYVTSNMAISLGRKYYYYPGGYFTSTRVGNLTVPQLSGTLEHLESFLDVLEQGLWVVYH
jgi:hypothetical protein